VLAVKRILSNLDRAIGPSVCRRPFPGKIVRFLRVSFLLIMVSSFWFTLFAQIIHSDFAAPDSLHPMQSESLRWTGCIFVPRFFGFNRAKPEKNPGVSPVLSPGPFGPIFINKGAVHQPNGCFASSCEDFTLNQPNLPESTGWPVA